jgi:RHS repeat-associated protein
LHRPLQTKIDNRIVNEVTYGDLITNAASFNLVGQVYESWGNCTYTKTPSYDFKGKPLNTILQLFADETVIDIDWSIAPALETKTYTTDSTVDALGRPLQTIDPAGHTTYYTYAESGALKKVEIQKAGTTVKQIIVNNIAYNVKGQREHVYYGNNTKTRYYYNKITNQLTRLLTTGNTGTVFHQDLNYNYDAIGNILQITDDAHQTIYFNNNAMQPVQSFVYDSLYRLVEARGREFSQFNGRDHTDSTNPTAVPNSNSLTQYAQKYVYDKVGNILSLIHTGANAYTREFSYDTLSNRLLNTETGTPAITMNPANAFVYDAHGNITKFQHLHAVQWNSMDQLSYVNCGDATNAIHNYYQYEAGQRIRKTTINGNIKEVRLYFGSLEFYAKFVSSSLTVARQMIHIGDDQGKVASIDLRTVGSAIDDNNTVDDLTRYVYSNHLQSASLELTDNGDIISYEEYHPYGTTSYTLKNTAIKAVAKRYRFTGKEKDTESGLYYHGARYYMCWLCRWCAVDMLEMEYSGWSGYQYTTCNPVMFTDLTGMGNDEVDELSNKLWGAVQLTGGLLQMGLGVVGMAAPTGVTQVVGAVAIVHGADDVMTGWRKMTSGKNHETATKQIVTATAQALGASKNTANKIGTGVGVLAGFAGGGGNIPTAAKAIAVTSSGVKVQKTIVVAKTINPAIKSVKNANATVVGGNKVLMAGNKDASNNNNSGNSGSNQNNPKSSTPKTSNPQIKDINGYKVGPHGKMPSPRPINTESHHGVMSSFMRTIYGKLYKAGEAPAVLLSKEQHKLTQDFYYQWAKKYGYNPNKMDWKNVSQAKLTELWTGMFKAAKVPDKVQVEYFNQLKNYFKNIKK